MPLWIVATPLGTLADMSPRAQRVLEQADVVACEDTRTTRRLLGALEIKAPPLVSLHAHNEARRVEGLVEQAQSSQVALVSDAGTPAVSDPGRLLVAACLEAGVEVRSVPGPSALSAALAASGLPVSPSAFLGFAPRKGRQGWVRRALERPETLVVYEAPSRVAELIRLFASLAPGRRGVLCRELSKQFEQVVAAPLEQLEARLPEPIRGECVLLVGPGDALQAERAAMADAATLKEVARVLAQRWGVTRREAYQRLLTLESEGGPTDG